MRRAIVLLAAVAMLGNLTSVSSAKKASAATVWKDPAGDADLGQGLGYSIPGGFDITGGSIARDKDSLVYTVTHADMPPNGSLPEAFRFMWAFAVDNETFRLTIKSADIGKPDVSQGQTTERVGRLDLNGHFRLEGKCGANVVVVGTFINCKPLGYLEGKWDPAKKTVTMMVPMKLVGAETGSVITAGTGDATTFCQICWGTHVAERSPNATLIDGATQSEAYKVPR